MLKKLIAAMLLVSTLAFAPAMAQAHEMHHHHHHHHHHHGY